MNDGVPSTVATYVGVSQTANGKVSSQAWANARVAGDFQLLGSKGSASQRTEVRVCYDKTNLYVRFECFEDRMDSLVVRHREDNRPVWQDDSVEVFICPYTVAGPSRCHQFVVNAAGAKAYLRPEWTGANDNWRAAVVRLPDRWLADITIPYAAIRPLGRNEDCWRINFGRNEHPHGETSSWSPVERWFLTYARFGKLIAPDGAFRFNTFRGIPALLQGRSGDGKGVQPITGPVKQTSSSLVIIPEPQELHNRITKAPFTITADTLIVVADAADEADMWAADELNAAIQSRGGSRLRILRGLTGLTEGMRDVILVGEPTRNRMLRSFCEKDSVRMPRSRFGTTSHVVDVLPERIIACGQTQVDTYYAVQTLKQLLRVETDGSVYVPAIEVRDYPRFGFRGAHLLASSDALPFLSKLIDRVLAPLKVNHIVLQTDKVVWKSHPEVTDPTNHMSQEDVKKLVEVARRHHIKVTPLVQSPGHLEWAFRNGKNLEFAEDPSVPYCYCMSNPKSYEFIFDIMDEAIELFGQPEYFHAGRDEFDMRGVVPHCEKCKPVGKERLYIQDTLKVCEHLRSRGCKMMMWGDILLKPGFRELAGELPKDILINDWHYSPSDSYPSVDFFQSLGFPVVGCTWYNPTNVFSFSGYGAKRSIEGMMQTTWTGFESEENVLSKYPSQAYSYVLSAAWAWNPVRPQVGNIPYRPETVFNRVWRDQGSPGESEFATVDLEPYCNVSRVDSGRGVGWLGIGRGNDLRGIPEGPVLISGVPYAVLPGALDVPAVVLLGADGMLDAFPRRVGGIRVDANVKGLHFLFGCAFSADDGVRVGSYVVNYEDGKSEEIPLVYERNAYAWDDQSLGMAYGFAWRGRAQDGRTVGVCDLAWTNNRPGVKVTSVDFIAERTEASPFLLAITARLEAKK